MVGQPDVATLAKALSEQRYIADDALATVLSIALHAERPLLLEGSPGVGKTSVAQALSGALGTTLIRLQCYEGIDMAQAAYEWNIAAQLLAIRQSEATQSAPPDLYSAAFLLQRPLLRALQSEGPKRPVLLIDEVDRADEEFEAYLLEMLDSFAISIPEFGTITARQKPVVILTSNRTRRLHDALKRRCFYHWLDSPDLEREQQILRMHCPDLSTELTTSVARALDRMRAMDVRKVPGIGEAVDWARALKQTGAERVTRQAAERTLGIVLKDPDDIRIVQAKVDNLVT